jgi:hypothetical protein
MMIARSLINITANVEGHQPPFLRFLPPTRERKLAGEIRRVMPSKRDREVPYGMKGGEH